jgi:precorrin-2 dehydrogenase/sirohydrochlorin ferrochelatase
MAYFPLFIDLKERCCLVVGGGTVALRKIETLLRFDAAITVISPAVQPGIGRLADAGRLTYQRKSYQSGDAAGYFLVIAATSVPEINRLVCEEASRLNIWVNSADDPRQCSFIFPAVVQNGDLVVGVSSSGQFPVLSRLLREQIAAFPLFQPGFSLRTWAKLRRQLQRESNDPEWRRSVLRAAGRKILKHSEANPREFIKLIHGEEHNEKD